MTIYNEHCIDRLKHLGARVGRTNSPSDEKERVWQRIDAFINQEILLRGEWFHKIGVEFIPRHCEGWQKGAVLIPKYCPDVKKCKGAAAKVNEWIMRNLM